MKELLIGNAAVARGLYDAGCAVISSYPGTPSTEITECFAKYDDVYCEWAPNEKVATEAAFGASLRGKRSSCCMKHVGLNVAADPLFTMSYTGVNGGMVICVADDPGMHSSQNEQDSRHYAIASKVPMLEPSNSQEAYDFARAAFDISEEFDTPVLLKMCTRVAHSQSIVETRERLTDTDKPYEKNPQKYIMAPANAIRRHPFVEERTAKLTAYAETSPLNRVEEGDGSKDFGVITSSTSYQYIKEIFGDTVPVLKLGIVNPLPVKLIKDFASKCGKVYVVEELDPIIETHCKNIGVDVIGKEVFSVTGEFSQKTIAKALGLEDKQSVKLEEEIPVRPPMMCAGCPHRGMFYVLSKNKITVLGDIGCYTL
ncbi:MAG: indolepyruvate ferredoxin oxidoreductase subunit alpha, partial [Ruminococcus sp.]|nr:indolepyruvate ferredoxin oxidoreductase subunit alpha [Ruminococcus sp.]